MAHCRSWCKNPKLLYCKAQYRRGAREGSTQNHAGLAISGALYVARPGSGSNAAYCTTCSESSSRSRVLQHNRSGCIVDVVAHGLEQTRAAPQDFRSVPCSQSSPAKQEGGLASPAIDHCLDLRAEALCAGHSCGSCALIAQKRDITRTKRKGFSRGFGEPSASPACSTSLSIPAHPQRFAQKDGILFVVEIA